MDRVRFMAGVREIRKSGRRDGFSPTRQSGRADSVPASVEKAPVAAAPSDMESPPVVRRIGRIVRRALTADELLLVESVSARHGACQLAVRSMSNAGSAVSARREIMYRMKQDGASAEHIADAFGCSLPCVLNSVRMIEARVWVARRRLEDRDIEVLYDLGWSFARFEAELAVGKARVLEAILSDDERSR